MATVYPTAAGAWSTRTWNNDATGAAYGMAPQVGDTVLANGLAITLNIDITVAALSNRVGTTAVAGGSFTTSGTLTITCNTYGGTANCLVLTASSNSVHVGNSFGSNTTSSAYGTTITATCIQTGNSTGGNGSFRIATNVLTGGIHNGNSTGGSVNSAYGTNVQTGGVQNGNSTGGSVSGAAGTNITAGGVQNGNSTAASAHGTLINSGGIQNGNSAGGSVADRYGTSVAGGGLQVGNSTGGSATSSYGTFLNTGGMQIGNSVGGSGDSAGTYVGAGALQNGNATGGSVSAAHGTLIDTGGIALITTATGNTAGAYGVRSFSSGRYVAIIKNEVGTYAKAITSAETNVPFTSFNCSGGGIPVARGMNGGMQ